MEFFSRAAWGASAGTGKRLIKRVRGVAIHHTYLPVSEPSDTVGVEAAMMRGMERYHVGPNGLFKNIPQRDRHFGYNWCHFMSGRVYEGLGWGRRGAHVGGHNSEFCGLALVMNGDIALPTQAAILSIRQTIQDGVTLGWIPKDYEVVGHFQYSDKSCPGKLLQDKLHIFRHDSTAEIHPPQDMSLPVLRLHSVHELVKIIQVILGVKGDPFGNFGIHTDGAVREFQRLNDLIIDGIVGPNAWEKMLMLRD